MPADGLADEAGDRIPHDARSPLAAPEFLACAPARPAPDGRARRRRGAVLRRGPRRESVFAAEYFALGERLSPFQYAASRAPLASRRRASPFKEAIMAYDLTNDFRRPVPLALAALAIVGWLLVSYFWSQASDVRAQMDDALKRAEAARATMASDLQNLQKAAGSAADLQKQAKDAQAALAQAVGARASAQNDLADLTKQISEAKLAVSGAQEEANAKTHELQNVDAKLKSESDQLAALESQITAAQARDAELQQRGDEAQRNLADLQQRADEAQRNLADLQQRVEEAQRDLANAQAKPQ
jgi:phage-related minor tail protein